MTRVKDRNSKKRKNKERNNAEPRHHEKFTGEHESKLKRFDLNHEQDRCSEVIQDCTLTIIRGEAGTGKTMAALFTFVDEYIHDHTKKIIIYRSPGEAGADKIGFLPGELNEKIAPHFKDNVEKLIDLLGYGKFHNDLNRRIFF